MLKIGDWAKRKGPYHLIDSLVADDVVTRCGRRIRAAGLTLQKVPFAGRNCRQCTG